MSKNKKYYGKELDSKDTNPYKKKKSKVKTYYGKEINHSDCKDEKYYNNA